MIHERHMFETVWEELRPDAIFWRIVWVKGKRLFGVENKVKMSEKEEPYIKCLPFGISKVITSF